MSEMVRLSQLLRKARLPQKERRASSPLDGQPQKKGVCLKVFTMSPKKPNSANRRVARIKVSGGQRFTCVIPGEGHTLQQYATILVKGGKAKDLPGVRLKAVRGKYDLTGVSGRKTSRSLYGVKKK